MSLSLNSDMARNCDEMVDLLFWAMGNKVLGFTVARAITDRKSDNLAEFMKVERETFMRERRRKTAEASPLCQINQSCDRYSSGKANTSGMAVCFFWQMN